MSGELTLHRIKTMNYRVDRWFADTPNSYVTHNIELVLEDGESFDIKLFTNDTAVTLEELPSRNLPSPERSFMPECSICRRYHGPEVVHASE